MSDTQECHLCGGTEEIEVVRQDGETDKAGCPECISTELYERLATQAAELERLQVIEAAVECSGLDISPCRGCGEAVVCVPDGMSSWCEECYPEAAEQVKEPTLDDAREAINRASMKSWQQDEAAEKAKGEQDDGPHWSQQPCM